VFAKRVADPVFEVAFSAVDFARPDSAQFTFRPPAGTRVTEGKATTGARTNTVAPQPNSADLPKTVGKGWGTVVVARAPAPAAVSSASGSSNAAPDSAAQLLKLVGMLPKVSGSWGSGHLIAGTVFSALITDDGRLVVGAVTPKGLYAALAAS